MHFRSRHRKKPFPKAEQHFQYAISEPLGPKYFSVSGMPLRNCRTTGTPHKKGGLSAESSKADEIYGFVSGLTHH